MPKLLDLTRTGWLATSMAFLMGASLALAFAPVSLSYWAFIPLLYLFWQLRECRDAKQGFWRAYAFGLGLFAVGISWVYVAINVYGAAHPILAGLLTLIFVAFMALFLGLFGWLSAYLLTRLPNKKHNLLAMLVLPASWLLVEWLRSWVLTGFPWLSIGYSQIDTVFAAYAPVIGVYGVGFMMALLTSSLLYLHKDWVWAIPVAFVVLASSLEKQQWSNPVKDPISFTIIQGNVEQATRWDREQFNKTLQLYTELTNQHWDSDVIIWPENAVPMFYHRIADQFFTPLEKRAQANDTDLLIGLPVMNVETKEYYNSLMSFGSSSGVYKKQHLVPFGEFLPLEDLLRGAIEFFNLPMSSFTPGESEQEMLTVKGVPLSTSICYEDVFPQEMLATAAKSQLLVNVSNNGWYGRSFAPYQHLEMARMRALENAREQVRSTTNGISAFIDSKGKIIDSTELFVTDTLTASVQPRSGITPYMQVGNYPAIIVATLILLLAFFFGRRATTV